METVSNKGLNYWHQYVIDNFNSWPERPSVCKEFKTRGGYEHHKCKGTKIIWRCVPCRNQNHFYKIKLYIDGKPKYLFVKYPFAKDSIIEYLGELNNNNHNDIINLYTHRLWCDKNGGINRYTFYL